MAAKRCSTCAINYPNSHEWAVCAVCLERTDLLTNEQPITPASARAIARQAKFDRFYEQTWEAKRQGPPPEEIGRQEAEALIRQAREINALPEP
jgi:hypothetical protein